MELTLTAIALLLLVLAVLWGLRGKRRHVGMTELEQQAYWAMIDDERGKR